MTVKITPIAYEGTTKLSFAKAVAACRAALQKEGFGVLSEIDIQAKLKEKLGVDLEPYLILGACHPPSAHRALGAEPAVGVLLPCNVTVSREDGKTVVRAMNPSGVMDALASPVIRDVGVSVGAALRRVVEQVAGESASHPPA
jgi:uncharacterized protein (DUF302 family)